MHSPHGVTEGTPSAARCGGRQGHLGATVSHDFFAQELAGGGRRVYRWARGGAGAPLAPEAQRDAAGHLGRAVEPWGGGGRWTTPLDSLPPVPQLRRADIRAIAAAVPAHKAAEADGWASRASAGGLARC